MTSYIYPNSILGLGWDYERTPRWKTGVQEALSGKQSTIAYMQYPLIHFNLNYELLRDDIPRTNLQPYSQDITQSSVWSMTSGGAGIQPVAVTNYAVAPDGTYNADRLILNLNGGSTSGDFSLLRNAGGVAAVPVVPGGTYTSSVYLKTNDGSTVVVAFYDNGSGAPGATQIQYCTVTPTWQRFSITKTWTNTYGATSIIYFGLVGSLAVSQYADLSVWGWQTEAGNNPTNLISTYLGTQATSSDLKSVIGLFNSVQGRYGSFLFRDVDFCSVTQEQFGMGNGTQTQFQVTADYQSSPYDPGYSEIIQNLDGLQDFYLTRYGLPESLSPFAVTNLLLQSQALATTWTQTNVTSTNNFSTAPDGTTTATKIVETTTNGVHEVFQNATVPSTEQIVTFSIYVNPNLTRTWCVLVLTELTGSTQAFAYFNLASGGSVGNTSIGTNWANLFTSITPCNNGFYQISITATKINAATSVRAALVIATANGTDSYTGVVTDGITGWGAQLELNNETPYINIGPTYYWPTTTAPAGGTFFTMGATGIMTTATPVPSGQILTWTGSWFYRCRFDEDEFEMQKFLTQWWNNKKVALTSIKL